MKNTSNMIVRFLSVVGLILLYMGAWALVLLGVIKLGGNNDSAILVGVLISTLVLLVGFVFYMNFVVKKVFFFPGEGQPVPEAELRSLIKSVNGIDAPIMVREKGNQLVVTWKYVDARWWELLAKAGLEKLYELHLKFDDQKKEVTLIDVTKSVSWRAGPTEVRVSGGFFRGVIFAYEIGKQWGIKENFQIGKVYDYKFVPQEIKNPVLNTIVRHGWGARFGIW